MTIKGPLIVGTMTWGKWGKNLSSGAMTSLIESIFEMELNAFDHADIYGGYTTEQAFGKAFKNSGVPREKVKFISKCGIMYPTENNSFRVKHYDYGAHHIRDSVENSLRNLQTDYLDCLLLHRPSPLMDPIEISETLETLQEEKKILHHGFSNFLPHQMACFPFNKAIANQVEFSLNHHSPIDNGTLNYHLKHHITSMAWTPLGSYFKIRDIKRHRIEKILKPLTQKYHATEAQLLLAWIHKLPHKIIPVVGSTKRHRVEKLIQASQIDLNIQDWFLMYEANNGHPVA
ncbi:MAG: aldo/keto reductase [Flavobacteriaceae bacterium]|nr:aldo/keto reductase [Flavobacteriaceae bacterium]